VELHVLARRDVTLAAGESLGDVGERLELLGRDEAAGQLRADHHHAVLALAVDAVEQTERAPVVGRQLAALEGLEPLDEQIDVGRAGEPEAPGGGRGGGQPPRMILRNIDAHDDLRAGSCVRENAICSASSTTAPITSTPGSSVANAAPPSAASAPVHVKP